MFTGKNKEEFENWLRIEVKNNYHFMQIENVIGFKLLPFSMQQGVYLEYLDSVGVFVEIWCDDFEEGNFGILINDEHVPFKIPGTSRQEALTEALKKADELINNTD